MPKDFILSLPSFKELHGTSKGAKAQSFSLHKTLFSNKNILAPLLLSAFA
jgi:hypothetical protein